MAKKSNKSAPKSSTTTLQAIVDGVTKLYSNHADEIEKIIDEAQAKAVTLNFKADIDRSNPAPMIDVHLRFSTAVTDAVKFTLDDPNQGSFKEIIGEKGGEPAVEADNEA